MAATFTIPSSGPLLSLLGSPSTSISVMVSCSHEALHSFDWSDFPVVGNVVEDEEDEQIYVIPCIPATSTSSSFTAAHTAIPPSTAEDRPRRVVDDASVKSPSVHVPPSSASSSQEILYSNNNNSTSTRQTPSKVQTSSPEQQHKNKKRLGFSPFVEIRTYAVTLGDHPCCSGGMALTCDWQIEHSALVDLDVHERYSLKRRNGDLRLTYPQRRHRLVDCTGLSPNELLQLEYEEQVKRNRAIQNRRNNFYHPVAHTNNNAVESSAFQYPCAMSSHDLQHQQQLSALRPPTARSPHRNFLLF